MRHRWTNKRTDKSRRRQLERDGAMLYFHMHTPRIKCNCLNDTTLNRFASDTFYWNERTKNDDLELYVLHCGVPFYFENQHDTLFSGMICQSTIWDSLKFRLASMIFVGGSKISFAIHEAHTFLFFWKWKRKSQKQTILVLERVYNISGRSIQ